jgi:hypothetical protein
MHMPIVHLAVRHPPLWPLFPTTTITMLKPPPAAPRESAVRPTTDVRVQMEGCVALYRSRLIRAGVANMAQLHTLAEQVIRRAKEMRR